MKAIMDPEFNKTVRLDKKQAGKIVEQHLGYIKGAIQHKIAIYDPLDFKTTYQKFISRLQEEEFLVLREIPAGGNVENILDDLIKNFLIENAYYALAEKYIQRIIMNKLSSADPNDIRVLETGDFIREKLEQEGLKKLKSFQEKSKFKTFLVTAVTRLLIDAWRQKGSIEENVIKYGPEFDAFFDPPVDDPLKKLIKLEDENFKEKAAAFLPRILDKLDYNEKLALKLKYEKDMKLSAIARTLGYTRFKAGLFIKQLEWRIFREISAELKKGGHHGTPGR
ncbi:MAG TPA: sigma-70 family RNA polymerase sigma factor [Candidatus Kapabacteria bacterium]|nr:sigma-70 family RNA polymerase sigma factor [Candidatus Kapabacteria bacterium]